MFNKAFGYKTSPDYFNAASALFSGAAIVGVVLTVYQQQLEMEETRREMRVSSDALNKQVDLAALSAKLQSIPIMINIQRQKIETLGATGFTEFSKIMPTKGKIEGFKATANKNITESTEDMKRHYVRLDLMRNPDNSETGNVYRKMGPGEIIRHESDAIASIKFHAERIAASQQTLVELDYMLNYINDLDETYLKMKSFQNHPIR